MQVSRIIVFSQIIVLATYVASAQLKVSADSLYLTDQNGTPVFLNGESAWCLFTAITYTDANTFLANCHAKGVNYLQTMLIEDGFTLNAPANAYGVTPFSGANFSTPREAYFLHCDSVINLAASYGIYLMLFPAYLGSNPFIGWQTEIAAESAATMKTYGRYVGARYKNFPNVVWSIGGDIQPSPWQAKCDSMAAGIRLEDPTNLMSTRDDSPTFAHTNWPNRYWLTLNGFYPYWGPANYLPERIYQMGKQSRSYSPKQPFVLQEAYYEGEGATQVQLRQQSYYGILGGAIAGQVYGNCPIWHFSQKPSSICGAGNWFNELESQGRINNKWVGKLFRSRYWYKLVPDTTQVVMTAGYGTNGNGTYVTTSYTYDSSSVIAYLPTARTVTINPAKLTGDSVQVYWFNPANGVVTDAGMYSKTSRAYSQPGSGDWVMVMDSKTFGGIFDVPGGNPPSAQTAPAPTVLATPANEATGIATNPTLTWNASVGATSYRLQVSTDPGFTTTVVDQSNITAISFGVTGLAPSTTYYWHANATNSGGTSAYSTTWNFTTAAPPPPPPPPLLNNPPNGTTGVSTNPTMTWSPSVGATSYRLQVSTDAGFATTAVDQSNIPTTSIALTSLATNTTYYWHVNATNGGGTSAYSTTSSFTTAAPPPPPAAPVLATPANGATGVATNPTLTWNASTGATSYRIQVSTDAGFATTIADQSNITTTSLALSSLSTNTQYYWHVNATNSGGTSAYSTTSSFTTVATPPGLVAAYAFDQGSGTTAADVSGNNLTGNIVGATWTTQGKYGNALSFNGTSSYVDLGNPAQLQLTGSMTWSAWVNAAANPPDDGQIIAKSDDGPGWQFKSSPDTGPHTFGVAVSGSAGSRAQRYSTTVRSLNTWYHVAGLYNATARTLDIYVNGVLDNGTLRGTIPASQIAGNLNVNIGRQGGGYYFNGVIDEVHIYNRALSQAEIQADMNTPVGAPAPPTLAAPPNGAIGIATNPTLTWNASSGAISYRVQVSTSSTFATTVVDQGGIATTSYPLSGLAANTTYYWRVNATGSGGTGAFSAVRHFTPGGAVRANMKVLLEGGYNAGTGQMDKTLNTVGILATRFAGVSIPVDAVDSISIELRDSAVAPTTRKFRPAWLLTDGIIRSFIDTTKGYVEFDTLPGNYYLVVWHRNHLGIMTSGAQALTGATPSPYDFTTSQSQAYGTNPMKQIGSRYAMIAGDTDLSGVINAADRLAVKVSTGASGYIAADVTLSGLINAADRLVVSNNTGAQSQVP